MAEIYPQGNRMDSLLPDPDNAGGGSMKTRLYSIFFFVLVSCSYVFASGAKDTSNVVVVYAYDSFTADWGPGPELKKRFEEKTGYKLELVTCEDAGAVLSKAILEKGKPNADVLVGIDNFLIEKARKAGVLQAYKSPNLARISNKDLLFEDSLLTPYDFGYFTVMYDSQSGIKAPTSFADLKKPEYKKALVTMDPRLSSPGLGFVMWIKAVTGDKSLAFWKDLKPSILTVSPGWSSGYGLFTSGEVAMAVSYTTSMAYHIKYDKTDRYQALIFPEGHIMQIEGLGLVKGAKNAEGAKAFIDFMLTEDAQSVLPETQWMYPVALEGALPESFEKVPMPKKVLDVNANPDDATKEMVNFLLEKN